MATVAVRKEQQVVTRSNPNTGKTVENIPLIDLCPSFWAMDTLAQRVERIEAGGFGFVKTDVWSLVCQGEIIPILRSFYADPERCLSKHRVRIFARDVPHQCHRVGRLLTSM